MSRLIVHIVFRLDYGGLENGLVNLLNGLAVVDGDAGPRHAIIALTEATSFQDRLTGAVPVFALGKRPGKDLGAYVRLFRLLRRLQPDIVHTRNIGTLDCALVAYAAGVPVRIHGEHGWDVADPDGTRTKYRWTRNACAPFVRKFVTVSEHLRQWLVQTVGVSNDKVTRICNGVDVERFRPSGRRECRLPAETFPPGAVVVGSVTRFSAIKDPLNLVDAFIRLCAEAREGDPPLRLLMVGDGDLHEAALAKLRDAGAASDAWLPGSRDDIPELMRCMDIFVLASLREGISNTVLEAMATGLPVIATATGGNPELVSPGRWGALVPPGDAVQLAVAIGRYARDAALRTQHGREARAAAIAQFSIAAMVDRYRRLYLEQLGGRLPAPPSSAAPAGPA